MCVEAGSETEAIRKICDRVVSPCKEIIEKIGISSSKEEKGIRFSLIEIIKNKNIIPVKRRSG